MKLFHGSLWHSTHAGKHWAQVCSTWPPAVTRHWLKRCFMTFSLHEFRYHDVCFLIPLKAELASSTQVRSMVHNPCDLTVFLSPSRIETSRLMKLEDDFHLPSESQFSILRTPPVLDQWSTTFHGPTTYILSLQIGTSCLWGLENGFLLSSNSQSRKSPFKR